MSLSRPVTVWFGPEESSLFGALHMPAVPTRGAVVLCPPLGREYAYSHSTFVQLASQLTQLGFAALRFDYRSTGDSFDRTADRSEARGFADDVKHAVDFVRTTGVAQVAVVGMRLGANFASVQRDTDPVDAVVLWDPCPTGRSFLRGQRALALFAGVRVADEDAATLDLPGFKVSPEMAREISGLDLLAGEPGSVEAGTYSNKVLLLTRSERVADHKLVDRFDLPHVVRREVKGQPELLDVHDDWPTVPAEGIATVAGWLDEVMPRSGSEMAVPNRSEITVEIPSAEPSPSAAPGGGTMLIRERAVWLGPAGLFGIETEPVLGGFGPVCVFVSVANEHRIGPGRLWVQLSRRLAAEGFRCVRIDVSGFGDSPARDGRLDQPVHSISAIEDVLDTTRAVSPDDPGNVVLFGLCSSGYQILEAALSLSARGVCALNPSVKFPPPEMASGGPMDDRRRFCLPVIRPRSAPREPRAVIWLKRRFPTLATKLGRSEQMLVWRSRSVIGHYRNGPGRRLEDLAQAGTDVLLICGPAEMQLFSESGLGFVRRGYRKEHLQVEAILTLDHGLFPARDREQVADLILDHVLGEFHRDAEPAGPAEREAAH